MDQSLIVTFGVTWSIAEEKAISNDKDIRNGCFQGGWQSSELALDWILLNEKDVNSYKLNL